MRREVVLIFILLSSIALAQVPLIGPSGCVDAPGMPCDEYDRPLYLSSEGSICYDGKTGERKPWEDCNLPPTDIGPAFDDKPDCETPNYTRDCNGECLVPGDMVWYDNDCIDECLAEVDADIARFEECVYGTPEQQKVETFVEVPKVEKAPAVEQEFDQSIDQDYVDEGLIDLGVDRSLEGGLEYDLREAVGLLRDPFAAKNEAAVKDGLEQTRKDMIRLRALRDPPL